jgi:hypothetical protein
MSFKEGDIVSFNEEKYTVVGWDEINEQLVIQADGSDEALGVDPDAVEMWTEEVEEIVAEEETVDEEASEDDDEETTEEEEASAIDSMVQDVLAKVRKEETESIDEVSDAAKTLKTTPIGDPRAKSAMMKSVIDVMASKDKGEWIDFYNKMIAQIGQEANDIPGGSAAKNKESVSATNPVREEVTELFGDEELTEEFKDKAAVLFETAVHIKAKQLEEELKETYDSQLEEAVQQITEQLTEKVDHYLSYVAEEWVEDNELAIENSLKNEFTESFIHGLRNLFAEHYVQFPEEEVEIVDALAEKVEELENALNDSENEKIEMAEVLEAFNREAIFDEVAEGLAMTQVEKLRELSESTEFDGDEEKFKKSLTILKEHHFKIKATESTLNEEVELEEETDETSSKQYISPYMGAYVQSIAKNVKK